MSITIKYILFAVFSTLGNLFTQWFSLKVYSGDFSLYLAMFLGTLIGLIIKYILDKKYIFYYETDSLNENHKLFLLYSLMGVFTTFIFWSMELFFHYLFPSPNAKYLGAVIGLSIGYIIKYLLDKKFVFKKDQNEIN